MPERFLLIGFSTSGVLLVLWVLFREKPLGKPLEWLLLSAVTLFVAPAIVLSALVFLFILVRKKPGKLLKWFLPGFIAMPMLIFIPIPMHNKLVCEFDDGDRMVVRQNYKYRAWAMFFRADPKKFTEISHFYYKPKGWIEGWKKIDDIGIRSGFVGEYDAANNNRLKYCSNFRKMDGVITTWGSFKLPKGDWQDTPYRRYYFKMKSLEIDEKKDGMKLARGVGLSLTQIDASTLLLEDPVVFSICSHLHACEVQAVLQSYSHDGGQTWSKMELTEDSKLYELGKPLFEQKGVARPVDWTGKK